MTVEPYAERSSVVQDYAKAIFSLERRSGEPVGNNELAERLGVPPGTASAMVKRLDELGLAKHTPYHGVRLTAEGRRVALRMLRRHRLLELFLAETLDLPWDRVHQEAELLEHSLSDELEAAIAERLGNPTHDPHGDPIPSPELELEEPVTISVAELEPGGEGRFVRVSDADPAILRHLGERGLKPGQRLRLVEREPFGGPFVVRVGRRTESLPPEIAHSMRVEAPA
jgi:DtxR family transcriptional regulator, Mn-dependent transcriptional regulator